MTLEERTLVVLPTYNERQNLPVVLSGIRSHGCDVLVVDDNSPDGTGALADEIAARDPHVLVLHRPAKAGLGSAYVAGFRHGLTLPYDRFVGMDADLSHKPAHLPSVIRASHAVGGLAIGSRYVTGGAIVGSPRRRLALSHGANVFARSVLGVRVGDCTSGYRCYPRSLLEKIDFDAIVADGYGFLIELLYRTIGLGFPVVEVPIRFEDRVAGKSKVSQAEIRKALLLVPRLRWQRLWSARRFQAGPARPVASAEIATGDGLGTAELTGVSTAWAEGERNRAESASR
jgi:dolichol-phosphate mannosyltransferase